jgi:hypothetical protein
VHFTVYENETVNDKTAELYGEEKRREEKSSV